MESFPIDESLDGAPVRGNLCISSLIKNSWGKIKYFFEDFFYLFRGEDINRGGRKVWLLEKAAINHPRAAICFIIGISRWENPFDTFFHLDWFGLGTSSTKKRESVGIFPKSGTPLPPVWEHVCEEEKIYSLFCNS